MAMRRASATFWLLAFSIWLAAAPASALPATVFWDGPTIEGRPGYGVGAANAASANAAGVPIVQPVGFQPLSLATSKLLADDIDRAIVPSSLLTTGSPITSLTLTSTWTEHNETGINLQNLYMVFERPIANGDVVYGPSDVGLTLGSNWVILQGVASGGVPLYYPAVSLGNLANGANAAFQLFYTLQNPPQELSQNNLELGMPAWNLFFLAAPVPEPTSGLLVLIGLLGIAGGRRKRS